MTKKEAFRIARKLLDQEFPRRKREYTGGRGGYTGGTKTSLLGARIDQKIFEQVKNKNFNHGPDIERALAFYCRLMDTE